LKRIKVNSGLQSYGSFGLRGKIMYYLLEQYTPYKFGGSLKLKLWLCTKPHFGRSFHY